MFPRFFLLTGVVRNLRPNPLPPLRLRAGSSPTLYVMRSHYVEPKHTVESAVISSFSLERQFESQFSTTARVGFEPALLADQALNRTVRLIEFRLFLLLTNVLFVIKWTTERRARRGAERKGNGSGGSDRSDGRQTQLHSGLPRRNNPHCEVRGGGWKPRPWIGPQFHNRAHRSGRRGSGQPTIPNDDYIIISVALVVL
jgi:hypothetical protein